MHTLGSKRAGSRGGRAAEGALERRLVRRGGAQRFDDVDVAQEALQVRRVLGDRLGSCRDRRARQREDACEAALEQLGEEAGARGLGELRQRATRPAAAQRAVTAAHVERTRRAPAAARRRAARGRAPPSPRRCAARPGGRPAGATPRASRRASQVDEREARATARRRRGARRRVEDDASARAPSGRRRRRARTLVRRCSPARKAFDGGLARGERAGRVSRRAFRGVAAPSEPRGVHRPPRALPHAAARAPERLGGGHPPLLELAGQPARALARHVAGDPARVEDDQVGHDAAVDLEDAGGVDVHVVAALLEADVHVERLERLARRRRQVGIELHVGAVVVLADPVGTCSQWDKRIVLLRVRRGVPSFERMTRCESSSRSCW